MKRILALLLVCMLLVTACETSGGDDNSSAVSSSGSGSVSEEEETPIIDPGYEGPFEHHTLVSVGKSYLRTAAPSGGTYTDYFNQQLTDGLKAPDVGVHYTDTRLVGFSASCLFEIDLGKEDAKNINAIAARTLDQTKDGVKLAKEATFYGSVDGSRYEELGTVTFEATGYLTMSTARLDLEFAKNYRYIRVKIEKASDGLFFFIDELEVYADVPEKEKPADTVAEAYKSENIDRNAWQTLSTGKEANPIGYDNLAYGGTYSFANCEFDTRAPQNDTLLTDGDRTNRIFSDAVWVGIKAKANDVSSINLTLNNKAENVYRIRVHASNAGLDVNFADYIDVYGTLNKKNYTLLGRMYAPTEGDNYAYTLVLPEYVKVKYLRFDFAPGSGNYWIEEIEVFGGYANALDEVVDAPVTFPEVTEELYWNKKDSDYNETQNLLLGKQHQFATSYYHTVKDKEHIEAPADSPILTDGLRAATTYCYATDWFYCRGRNTPADLFDGSVDFFFDLGYISTLTSFNASILEQGEWGITRPKFVTVLLSNDAEHWYPVAYEARGDAQINSSATRLDIKMELEQPYAARFVRFRLEGSGTYFIDELEAFGTKKVSDDTVRIEDSGLYASIYHTREETLDFAGTDNTSVKAHDISFVKTTMTDTDRLLPYAAYLDKDGNIADTFMDGFILTPGDDVPSKSDISKASNKADWEYLLDCVFNGPTGMNHIEEVIQTVKDSLNKPDYKVQIYITLYPIRDTVTDFGDVDGDGVSENLTIKEDREKVLNWFFTKCVDDFNARGYKNLELGGFWWYNESVGLGDDDTHLMKETADAIHAKNLSFIWIPYYAANRYYVGYEMGFDMVSMQPNVMFDADAPMFRFDHTDMVSAQLGMCVEIEHSYQALSDPHFARTYMLYLYHGVISGYMDSTRIYYDDRDNIGQMGRSSMGLRRMQYDATYQFSKGTLNAYPEKIDDISITVTSDTIYDGTLNPEDALANYTLVSMPEHGSIVLTVDGTYRFLPEKGYKGTDTFTYTYNNYLGESEVCTVNITIE